MKPLNTYLLLSLSIICFSCNDFLDIKPKDKTIPQYTRDYETLLNSYTIVETIGVYSTFFTDDVYLPDNDSTGLALNAQYQEIQNFYSFSEELYSIDKTDRDWEKPYSIIYTLNLIINDVLDSEGEEAYKKTIYAEALVSRAFQYLNLLTLYAKAYHPDTADKNPGVPLILEADINKTNLKRASVQEIYDRLISDLKEAIPLLPSVPRLNSFRGSKASAYGLLARIYLYQGNYKAALEQANLALKEKSVLIDYNNYEVVYPDASSGRVNVPYHEKNPENIFVLKTSASLIMNGRSYISPDLLKLFDPTTDRRFQLFITKKYKRRVRPYYIWAPTIDLNMGISTPELYLTAAECEARLGNTEAAMNHLNELRRHRYQNYAPITASTSKEAVALVLDERRRELTMIPPHRLADIKRLGNDPDFAKPIVRTIYGKEIRVEPTSNLLVMSIPPIVLMYNPEMEPNIRK